MNTIKYLNKFRDSIKKEEIFNQLVPFESEENMWISIVCCIVIFNIRRTQVIAASENSFDPIMNQLAEELKPRQVVLFVNSKSLDNDIICRNIISRFQTVTVDLKLMGNHLSLHIPGLNNPSSSTVFVIIESQNYTGPGMENVRGALSTSIQLAPVSTRPKCLVIISRATRNFEPDLETIMKRAWSSKFLDFSILTVSSNNSQMLFNYNPFSNRFYRRYFNGGITIFPYKLKNLHGYPIKVPAFQLAPYIKVVRNSIGEIINSEGPSYEYCRILSKSLNFTPAFVTGFEDSVLRANFFTLFQKFSSGEIDMLTFPFNVRSIMYHFQDSLLMGKLFLNTNYVLVVPIISEIEVQIPPEIILFIPLLFIAIFIYSCFAKISKFSENNWSVVKIFQILLGVTVPRRSPRKLTEKIVYMSLTAFSMRYSFETLTKFMDIKLLKSEVGFDNMKEITESKLPVYTLQFIIDHVFTDNCDKTIEMLRQKTYGTTDIYRCAHEAAENKSCMCIIPHSAGAYVAKQFINQDGTPNMKVARPSLYDDVAAFAFSRASPYVRRYDQFVQRIVESGISDTWSLAQHYTIKSSDYKESKPITKNLFLLQLYSILSVGFITAGLAFAVELAIGSTAAWPAFALTGFVDRTRFGSSLNPDLSGSRLTGDIA